MDPFPRVIELSDDDEDYSDGSVYDFERNFLANDSEIEIDDEPLDVGQDNGIRPSGRRNLLDGYQSCLRDVLEVFPDISHDHVQKLFSKENENLGANAGQEITVAPRLIENILDHGVYPKEKDRIRELKRKRTDKDNDEEEAAKWKYMDLRDDPAEYARVARLALQEAFEFVPIKFIQDIFKEHGHYYGAFFAILKAEREYNPSTREPFSKLNQKRRGNGPDAKTLMSNLQMAGFGFEALKKEMDSALQRRKREDAQRRAAEEAERAEEIRDQEYISKGEAMDCGCCCETVAIPKMTHCDGDEPHFFCLECARRNANNDIGNSQYKLRCMDFSDCNATFSRDQRLRFLDEKTIEKLERLQQQEELRLADLDNLSTCPFCDFAAICPPIEEDREFRCHNPRCEEVSCRLCKMKSHVPLTCEEHKKENGISERRVIEEARTEALIRTCNKCKVRILKEDGCNKVICTSCYAVLCDYCGNDITKAMYNHFDNEGGRAPHGPTTAPGKKCPLYDESNKRKDRQVDAAEKEAMEKVRAEHPELTEEDLKIRFAAGVHQSSNRNHRHRGRHHPEFFGPLPENGIGNPPPLQFGPRFGDEHPNMMGAVPGAFPAMIEEQQRLQQQHQQHQAAYRAYMQAQLHQQQMQQRLQQVRMQQEVLTRRAQDYVDRNQDRAREDLIPNGQDMRRDRAPFGAGGAFGEERQYGNHGQVMSDQSRFNDRPNEPAHRRHAPPDRPAEVPNGRLHLVAPPPGARQAEDAARRAQRVRDDIALLQNRLEEAEELRQRRQRRPPREPIRRNAMTIDDEFFAAPFPNNPWV